MSKKDKKKLVPKLAPHDEFFKNMFSNKKTAINLLKNKLPADVINKISLDTIRVEQESYVNEQLKKYYSDVVLSVKTKDNKNAYVYFLIEHQSSNDNLISFRLWEYSLLLLKKYSKQNKDKKLPSIFHMVVYNGKAKYTAPRNFWNLFEEPEIAKEMLNSDYHLIDLQSMSSEELSAQEDYNMLLFMLKHIHDKDLLSIISKIMNIFSKVIKDDKKQTYILLKLVICYTENKLAKDDKIALEGLLSRHLDKNDQGEIMQTIADSYREEGIQKGIEKGREEGRFNTALNMLKKGFDISLINEITSLPKNEIAKLKASIQ